MALLFLFIVLVVCILYIPLRVGVLIEYGKKDEPGHIQLFLWNKKVYTVTLTSRSKEQSLQKKEENAGDVAKKRNIDSSFIHTYKERLTSIYHFMRHTYKITDSFLKKVYVHTCTWHTEIGVDNAALTGPLAGHIWMIKGNVVGFVAKRMHMKERPQLSVQPRFQETVICIQFSCIVSFRIGHAIFATILFIYRAFLLRKKQKIYIYLEKTYKRRKSTWMNISTRFKD